MSCRASVIIPVYNAEKTLRRCVESLVLGRERHMEVILVEDCSKDGSWEVCRELAAEFPNVICIQNEKNSGVSYTRNQGIDAARGEYILFVDSDDWVSERYAEALLKMAEENKDRLAICGQHFIDKVSGAKRDYAWDGEPGTVHEVYSERFFELSDKFLLQQLWNKIFRRDIIESAHIRFDETQSMGEDFQFVLDYMEAAQIKKCVVLNEPLYYYIRWNNTSLMSKFGPATRDKAIARFDQLRRICGENNENVQKQYQKALDDLKNNYIYHTVRANNLTKEEKLDTIRELAGGEDCRAIYRQQRLVFWKEQVVSGCHQLTALPRRVRGKIQRSHFQKTVANMQKTLKAEGFSIISQNCIGGVFYHDMGMQFLSPTVDLFFKEPDFVKFAMNLRHYLSCELQMRWEETCPVGTLDDITVYFMHYDTCREAKESWERRKQRISFEKILVVATDRNGFDDTVFETWKQIPYPKVLFTVNPRYAQETGSVLFPQYQDQGFVPDLIPGREFYKDGVLMNTVNQLGGNANDPSGRA